VQRKLLFPVGTVTDQQGVFFILFLGTFTFDQLQNRKQSTYCYAQGTVRYMAGIGD
jgi:hypothetical protein